MIFEEELKRGVIFADNESEEYVYMPASEIGLDNPLLVYENEGKCSDVDMHEALRLIGVRALRPGRHPKLGTSSC
ncbi:MULTISPECIES: hypothetical protein [unclassified Selenomonas]|jgi:hypothetical protein|uniref:hypothetical protein n=1 Tax=unclassified Selenomonas TaxID=2637378 RepID=UPI000497CF7C|nr:hypothetical protein SAMN05216583_14619 [Selenomonas ruminantium]